MRENKSTSRQTSNSPRKKRTLTWVTPNKSQTLGKAPVHHHTASEFSTPPVCVAILPRIDLPRTRTLLSAILPDKVNDYLQVNISLPQISMAQDKTSAFAKTTAHKQTPTTATATANATSERSSRATRRKKRKDLPAAPTSPTPQSMVVGDLRTLDEDDGRGRRQKRRRRRRWKSILIVYSEKQAVVSTVMCTRVETKRKENCTGLWVRSRIYSTGIVYSHSVSVRLHYPFFPFLFQ